MHDIVIMDISLMFILEFVFNIIISIITLLHLINNLVEYFDEKVYGLDKGCPFKSNLTYVIAASTNEAIFNYFSILFICDFKLPKIFIFFIMFYFTLKVIRNVAYCYKQKIKQIQVPDIKITGNSFYYIITLYGLCSIWNLHPITRLFGEDIFHF